MILFLDTIYCDSVSVIDSFFQAVFFTPVAVFDFCCVFEPQMTSPFTSRPIIVLVNVRGRSREHYFAKKKCYCAAKSFPVEPELHSHSFLEVQSWKETGINPCSRRARSARAVAIRAERGRDLSVVDCQARSLPSPVPKAAECRGADSCSAHSEPGTAARTFGPVCAPSEEALCLFRSRSSQHYGLDGSANGLSPSSQPPSRELCRSEQYACQAGLRPALAMQAADRRIAASCVA